LLYLVSVVSCIAKFQISSHHFEGCGFKPVRCLVKEASYEMLGRKEGY